MSKFYKFVLLLAVTFTISAYAIPKGPCDKVEVCCEEPKDFFAFSYPKDIGLSCPRDFYVHGEFLLMKPTQEGLEYAMEQDATHSYTFPVEVGKIKGFSSDSQEWDWKPGFRVGFGYYSNYDGWNMDVNWTYLRIKADSTVDNGGSGSLLPLFLPAYAGIDTLTIRDASSRWSGDFSTIDLMAGKPYHVSRYFISNPMFGIRAAWIDQDYHIRYNISYGTLTSKQNVFLKNDYWGVGLRAFYEGQFLVSNNFLIYGKAAVSLLFSKFDISQQSDVRIGGHPYPNSWKYNFEDSFYNIQPNAELGFGINWGRFFNKNKYKIVLNIGYEFHQWWDQNQARKFYDPNPVANDTVSRGDLSFNGFLFGLNIDF